MSNPNPPTSAPRWFRRVGLLALLGYALFLHGHSTAAAGGSDSSGYMNSAKLMRSGHVATEVRWPTIFAGYRELFWPDFQPLGFKASAERTFMPPTYPTGLPLHLLVAGTIAGWEHGPWVVEMLNVIAAALLCYLLGRELGLAWPLAASGAAALVVCPIFLLISIQPLSDALATTWSMAACLAGLRAGKQGPHAARGWATACGAAFGMAVLVRPTNAVLVAPLLLFLGLHWRRLLAATLGGLPFAAWLGWYNHVNYGSAFRSGYYPIAPAFHADIAGPTAWHFLRWLAVFLPALLLVLPLAALALREYRTRTTWALLAWFVIITGLYTFYEFSQEAWSGLRFILPAIPALILAALVGLQVLTLRFLRHRTWLGIFALVLATWSLADARHFTHTLGIFQTKGYEDNYAIAARAARDQFPPGALIVCSQLSGAVYYYTDFALLRWDHISATKFAGYREIAQQHGLPIRALIFTMEEAAALRERCPGNWVQIGRVANIGLWQLN